MNIKNAAIAGIAALTLVTGFMAGHAVSNNRQVFAKSAETELIGRDQSNDNMRQMTEETATETTLSLQDLKEPDIHPFNLPSLDFKAYIAENISITDTGTIITSGNGDGFCLEKGDIIRVNSISKNDIVDAQFYVVGYVKNEIYTNTTVGSMKTPATAWEILADDDAGDYEFYIKTDNGNIDNHMFDVIITVEKQGN